MKRPKAHKGPSETSGRRTSKGRSKDGRSAPMVGWIDDSPPVPALVVRVEIEAEGPEFYLDCGTDEDERSLRSGWARTRPLSPSWSRSSRESSTTFEKRHEPTDCPAEGLDGCRRGGSPAAYMGRCDAGLEHRGLSLDPLRSPRPRTPTRRRGTAQSTSRGAAPGARLLLPRKAWTSRRHR